MFDRDQRDIVNALVPQHRGKRSDGRRKKLFCPNLPRFRQLQVVRTDSSLKQISIYLLINHYLSKDYSVVVRRQILWVNDNTPENVEDTKYATFQNVNGYIAVELR